MTTQELTRPTIPAEEYADRWRRVQTMLAEQEIDLLVAYADDRATFGPAHARWLADFPVHFEPACILVPREGSPVMLVGPESDEYARLRGQIADVRVLRELAHPMRTTRTPSSRDSSDILDERRHGGAFAPARGPRGSGSRWAPTRFGHSRRRCPASSGSTWRTPSATCEP